MPNWATEKPVKKNEKNMAYKMRRDAQRCTKQKKPSSWRGFAEISCF